MTAYYLILYFCFSGSSTCDETVDWSQSYPSVEACSRDAPEVSSAWLVENPGYRSGGWTCTGQRPGDLPAK